MLRRITIIIGVIMACMVGSGILKAEEDGKSIGAGNSDGLTEFQFLPFITSYPSVWFIKSPESPAYLQNYANNAGCNWLGIAGEVFDLQGDPVPVGIYHVHVWESGIDTRVPVGGAPAYGPSGYEQFLFDSPRVEDHKLQLETLDGRPVSPIYEVQTRATCYENLLYFVFIQLN